MTPTLKKVIIGIVVLVVLFFAYKMVSNKEEESNLLISNSNSLSANRSLSQAKILGAQITQALMQIKTIDLDRDIFSSALFESLTDRGETISLEPIGRKNPFASLSDTSVNFNSDASSFVEEEGDGLNASTTVEDDPALPGSGGGDSLDEDLPPSQLNFN